ncbi:site-specific integrase [Aquabacterium sp. A7-Y]|uniref:site-specific integrase n=1 Tax=Aquabacterium sp. A7-Y TaxID=1349605 RepID=UPI00223DAB04|nr:site-specific integrase [Aquabacterium sp. A7-Y]MCW7541472.1 site-specific integrase [Aquabacterium sp. A7-Y]
MATVRARGSKFELRVKSKMLPRGIFTATFETEVAARNYGEQLEALLSQGLVPQDLMAERSRASVPTLGKLIREYLNTQPASNLDAEVLELLFSQIGGVRSSDISYPWAETWVRALKLQHNLAPGTIRKRVGALARLLDWWLKRTAEAGGQPLANPLRLLPKNYSTYNDHERKQLAATEDKEGEKAKKAKEDVQRDRRLTPQEEVRIVAALKGEKREDRERALLLPDGEALLELFLLIVNTGLRLREAYRLRAGDINLEHKVVHVERSKTGVGRDVPIIRSLYPMLERRAREAASAGGVSAPIFPWWDGSDDKQELKQVTSYLSRAFSRAFEYAQCADLTEHDLRHEATCRWILLPDKTGSWLFRTEEVMRITGHKDPRTFMRYVSLRGSDLAAKLW